MSNALGIASVTHVLKDLLYDGLINQNVSGVLGNPIHVSSLPPGELPASNGSIPSQINIFLYRVSPNTGWNNAAYPNRNAGGEVVRSAPLAVNLHYMLTAFGEQELHSEILLGYAMQILHENPVLYRDKLSNSLTAATITDQGGRLPANLKALATSGLADQTELIKLTPEAINTEEISKLWAAFQTKYRPCTGYLATVVLIESDKPARPALPVKERNIYVLPFRYPNISKVLSQESTNLPISENRRVTIGNRLIIEGHQLKNKKVVVKISDKEVAVNDADVSETKIAIDLSNAIGLKAGVQGVQVVHEVSIGEAPNARDMKWASSNLLAFVLSPDITITNKNVTPTGNNLNDVNLTIQVNPQVHPRQRVVLFLNEINTGTGHTAATYSLVFPPAAIVNPVNSIIFASSRIKNGTYLVRIQVDGAESPLEANTDGEYDYPSITIP